MSESIEVNETIKAAEAVANFNDFTFNEVIHRAAIVINHVCAGCGNAFSYPVISTALDTATMDGDNTGSIAMTEEDMPALICGTCFVKL